MPDEEKAMTEAGSRRLKWARDHMPVLGTLKQEILAAGHLKDKKISMALHTEAKTGILAQTLAETGAKVRLASCNPLSTDDTIVYALNNEELSSGSLDVKAKRGIDRDSYYEALNWTLDQGPEIIIDDGGDLIRILHTERMDLLKDVLGGCEETTTGIIRLKALQSQGGLRFPVMDVNDCDMKHLFDNRYGTGQSTMDGILTATNLTIAGRECVVAGYGWCGKGIAMRLKGMGAVVTVCEVDPVRAVEAAMDGFRVAPMREASRTASMIVTSTGCKDVVTGDVIKGLPDGCVLANSGHFDNEIDTAYLRESSDSYFKARDDVDGFRFKGRTIYLLSEGRLVNLAAGQGHPVEIMDMSFALQAAGAEIIAKGSSELPNEVIPFPREIDERIAHLKLLAMGRSIDELTDVQRSYLSSWEEGT